MVEKGQLLQKQLNQAQADNMDLKGALNGCQGQLEMEKKKAHAMEKDLQVLAQNDSKNQSLAKEVQLMAMHLDKKTNELEQWKARNQQLENEIDKLRQRNMELEY